MSTSYVDEYLVKLGASVDQSGLARFHQALREASAVSEASAASIAGSFVKAQTEIIAGFVAIGSAAIGLVDKVAMADQSYRLFAMHMMMSKDAARSLKVAMDALGEPLENLTWDKELRDRTHQLIADQHAMAPNGDFEAQMKKVRDIRFEFTRMEVEGEYLAMHVVQDFMKALGVGPDDLLAKLRMFNDWATHNLPAISDKLVHLFLPVWKDVKEVALSTAVALQAVGLAFTNIVGALTGDTALEGATFDFEKFAGALQHVVHWFALFAEVINSSITAVANLTANVAELFSKFPAPVIDAVIGGGLGFLAAGPLGAVAGAAAGVAIGPWGQPRTTGSSSAGSTTAQQAIVAAQQVSKATGIPADLVWAQWAHETGGFTNRGARELNNFAGVNVPGGKGEDYRKFSSADDFGHYYSYLMRPGGLYSGAKNAQTPEEFASILKAGGYYTGNEHDYASGVSRYQGVYQQMTHGGAGNSVSSHSIGNVTIQIHQQPGESSVALASHVKSQLTDLNNKQVQRNLNEFQDASWSY